MSDDQKKTDSVPATPEESRTQLEDIKNNVKKLSEELHTLSAEGRNDLEKFDIHLQGIGETIIKDTRETLSQMKESLEGYTSMKSNLDTRDDEIKQLRDGYNTNIFRDFLKRFIRIDETAREYAQSVNMSEEDVRRNFRMICDLFEDALEHCNVVRFSPEINENYRKAFGIADNPEIEWTKEANKDCQIAKVLSEGYKFNNTSNAPTDVLIKAKVKVFKHQKES